MEEDFAATTTIGERVAPQPVARAPKPAGPQGPSFGIPSKLEPFCLLAKSARGAGAANLIGQACAAPGVYVFSELLAQPSIKDLANNEQYAASYYLLELFAYGTWSEYVEKRTSLPELNKAQETKLKQLTILTLAMTSRVISYATLLSTLDLPSVPVLEDLLIDAFYSGVLSGRLDQKQARLEVMSSLGRDVRASTSAAAPEAMELDAASSSGAPSIESLTTSLTAWLTTVTYLLSSLDRHLATLAADAVNDANLQSEHEKAVESTLAEVQSKAKDKDGGGKDRDKDKGSSWTDNVVGGIGRIVGGAMGGGATREEMDVDEKDSGGGPSDTRLSMSPSGAAGRMRKRGRT